MMHYEVICKKCQGTSKVAISRDDTLGWVSVNSVISARKRLDGQWGFQCLCGANDLMTKQEERTVSNPAHFSPQEIDQILKNLVPDKPKFDMKVLA